MQVRHCFPSPLRLIFLIVSFILSSSCSTIENLRFRYTDYAQVSIQGDTLYFKGSMNSAANKKLFRLYGDAEVKPTRLKIKSGGGDVLLGIELGYFVHEHQLDVEVDQYCGSSCANYVFTAARQKILRKDSVLFWHGSSYQPNMDQILRNNNDEEKLTPFIKDWRLADNQFFRTVQVSPTITVYGMLADPRWAEATKRETPPYIMGWAYSVDDMKKFGVTNVVLKDGEWEWQVSDPELNWELLLVPVNDNALIIDPKSL